MSEEFNLPSEEWEDANADAFVDEMYAQLGESFVLPERFWERVEGLTAYQRHVFASQIEWCVAMFVRVVRIGNPGQNAVTSDIMDMSMVFSVVRFLQAHASALPADSVGSLFGEDAERWLQAIKFATDDDDDE